MWRKVFVFLVSSDHGTDFKNEEFKMFCESYDIHYNFSSPRTFKQNEIMKRKNKTLQEMVKTMLES